MVTWATTATLVGLAAGSQPGLPADPPRLAGVAAAAHPYIAGRLRHRRAARRPPAHRNRRSRMAAGADRRHRSDRRGDGHAGGARTGSVPTRRDRIHRDPRRAAATSPLRRPRCGCDRGWGLCELNCAHRDGRQAPCLSRLRQIARYAWLAGDRRLQEIGIKSYHLRGQGTDFKQLSEYRTGDSVRYIDWRATARLAKPIVREFQDERDQCVHVPRRLRTPACAADDRQSVAGTTHFDQVLNAVMLLTYVALKQGDAVGAMTFGTVERPPAVLSGAEGPAGAQRADGTALRRRADADALGLTGGGAGPAAPASQARRWSSWSPISATRTAPSWRTRCACCARAISCCSPACASASSAS